MNKYIDAEQLKAEIERQKHELELSIQSQGDYGQSCHIVDYENILSLIDSFQQEQPAKRSYKDCNGCKYNRRLRDQIGWQFQGCFGGDYKGKPIAEIELCPLKLAVQQEQSEVGLEKEIDACWQNWLSPSSSREVEGVLPKTEFEMYARHFAEWGASHLNARKEE